MNMLSKLTKVEFQLSEKTRQAIATSGNSSFTAIAAACVEGGIAEASVREVVDAIRNAGGMKCETSTIAAGLKSAKDGGDVVAVENAMREKAKENASKARETREKANKARAEKEAQEAEMTQSLTVAALTGDEKTILTAKLAVASKLHETAVEKSDKARDAYEKAKQEETKISALVTQLTNELNALTETVEQVS